MVITLPNNRVKAEIEWILFRSWNERLSHPKSIGGVVAITTARNWPVGDKKS